MILDLINEETAIARSGQQARIVLKLNSLVDEQIIEGLYEAAQAGVSVDLVVRGICVLRPGVPNLSESIRVRSILGRFLEHSRIFYFRHRGDDEQVYVGSADMMHRNLDRRVEALVHIRSPKIRAELLDTLELALADNDSSWELDASASWTKWVRAEGRTV